MKTSFAWRPIPVRIRLAAVLAATTTTGSIAAALLLSFHHASPERWLAPTPDLMEAAAGCDRLAQREARDQCKQALVAARLAATRRQIQLAGR